MQKQFVIFELANLKYAIDIEFVNEITSAGDITSLPKSSPFIEGVVNLRGNVIPLIRLDRVFNTEIIEKETHQIIIVNTEKEQIELIIDSAKDVKTFEIDEIKPIHSIFGMGGKFVTDTITVNEEIIQMISVDNIIHHCDAELHASEGVY